MLTKVILDGPLGKQFGREWNLAVSSPREALALINANEPGVRRWIQGNARKYSKYAIVCKVGDRVEEFNEVQYQSQEGVFDEIRFVPVIAGAGSAARILVGVVMVVVGAFVPPLAPYLYPLGASLILGGLAAMLAPKPDMDTGLDRENKTSTYFDGPAQTTTQGVPVQLIYGRCLVGSHAISVAVTVDQLLSEE